MNQPTLSDALLSLAPGAQWSHGGDYASIAWYSEDIPQPTEKEVKAELVRLKEEYEFHEYQRQRAPEYPPIGDQLDALFHAGMFPEEMTQLIQAVKDKYPKPE